jgi:pimeloyl-ACP methyl ester carboxylesterase
MTKITSWRHAPRLVLCILAATLLAQGCASPTQPMRHRQLLVQDQVHIDVIVEGKGPALVLLPSSQRDSEDFDELAARLASQGFRVLRPQPRGMGQSRGPMENLSLHILARDVALTIEKLGNGRAVLVGHAFGHFVARVADMNHPSLVRGVVVLGAAAKTFPAGMLEALFVAANPKLPQEERLKALQFSMFAPGNDASSWLDGWHPQVTPAYRAAANIPPKSVWWSVSNSPILDLQGGQDPWRPESTRNELKDQLGDKVTVRVIPRAGHALVPEQPEAITTAIADWVRQLPP